MYYKRHEQPGCGGCFLFLFLGMLLFGGGKFLGFLLFSGLFLMMAVVAGFWGFSYYIKRQIGKYEQSQTETHNIFVTLLINILVKIAQVDGEATREEIQTISNFFRYNLRYSQPQLLWVKELIKEAVQATESLESLLAEFRSRFAYEPRLILLELVYQVIYTKDTIPDPELELAINIAEFLEISYYDHQAIRSKFMARARKAAFSEDQYYKVLGLEPGAEFEPIKKSYRRLSMQYHPDKVGHLGEEFRSVAEEKMKEINAAYQYLEDKFKQ